MPVPFTEIAVEIANGKVTLGRKDFDKLLSLTDKKVSLTTTTTVRLDPKKKRGPKKKLVIK